MGFKVNYKLQNQTFSTQNKPKTISITGHPKHKIIIQITRNCLLDLLPPTIPTGKITDISLSWRGERFRIFKQYGFHTFLLQYKNKVHLELYQMSKMEYFTKMVNSFYLLTIFAKHIILDAWHGSEYGGSELLKLICHGSKMDIWESLLYG